MPEPFKQRPSRLGKARAVSGKGGGKASGAAKKSAPDPLAAWSPQRQTRGLPRPVKEWVCRGLEFTDAGLGEATQAQNFGSNFQNIFLSIVCPKIIWAKCKFEDSKYRN